MNAKSTALLVFGLTMFDFVYGQTSPFRPETYLNKEFQFFELRTLDNKKIGINNLKGKPSLLNFWFTSCKPCIEEMPVLNGLKNRFLDSVNFVAITFETKGRVTNFFEKHKFDFTQIINAKSFTDKLGIKAYPVNIFLDKNGFVTNIEIGMPYILDQNKNPTIRDGREFQGILTKLLSQ
jgi:thiol-disulfide isomerase/thioredoxin